MALALNAKSVTFNKASLSKLDTVFEIAAQEFGLQPHIHDVNTLRKSNRLLRIQITETIN